MNKFSKQAILTTITGAVLLLASMTIHATMLTNYSYHGASRAIINNSDRIEYLHFSQTIGMSSQEAIASFGQEGWTLASDAQGANLIGDMLSLSTYYENLIANGYNYSSSYTKDTTVDPIGDLFGYTSYTPAGTYSVNGAYFVTDIEAVSFLYGDYALDGILSIFSTSGDFTKRTFHSTGPIDYVSYGYTGINQVYSAARVDYSSPARAVLLVREMPSQQNIQSVPEPSAIALMGLGLLGLASARRKTKKQ